MRIRDSRVTYNAGAENKDPISIVIFIWVEGICYEKSVFVFIRHTLWQKFVCILKKSCKISKSYSARKTKILKIEILGWGFYLEISWASTNKNPSPLGLVARFPFISLYLVLSRWSQLVFNQFFMIIFHRIKYTLQNTDKGKQPGLYMFSLQDLDIFVID